MAAKKAEYGFSQVKKDLDEVLNTVSDAKFAAENAETHAIGANDSVGDLDCALSDIRSRMDALDSNLFNYLLIVLGFQAAMAGVIILVGSLT